MRPLEPVHHRLQLRNAKRRFKHDSFDTHSIVYNLLALASVLTGIWLSVRSGDWQWFSRSGSLLVLLGILLTSSQVIENSKRLKQRRDHSDSRFRHDYAGDYPQQRLHRGAVHEEDIWASGLRGFYLLVAGTLIWGFGDIVGLLM